MSPRIAVPLVLALSALGAACAMSPTLTSGPERPCVVGSVCSVTGVLRIFPSVPATGASVTGADGTCTVVALPQTVVRERDRWHRQTVTVTGDALARGGEGDPVAATTYRDRSVASGMCGPGPVVLYVTDIREAPVSAE